MSENQEEVCEVDITPVGCYKENTNSFALQNVFYNEADPGRPNFGGRLVQWSNDFAADFEKFLCKCAHLARSNRWEYFGVREIGKSKTPWGILPYMAYTEMCRWTGFGFCPRCSLKRIYNFARACPNYKQGVACTIDLIC